MQLTFIWIFIALFSPFVCEAGNALRGIVRDGTARPVPGASVQLRNVATGSSEEQASDAHGRFVYNDLAGSDYLLEVWAPGFARQTIRVSGGQLSSAEELAIELRIAALAEKLTVQATHIAADPAERNRKPGSIEIVTPAMLAESRVFTVDEALRKVSGVNTRGEEGFGLRPNIGIRGLSPTRSSRVLLLEDGIPLSYAPYGDNASYYHPPIDRFESVEVLKGSGQIVYGPMTVGGVINYVTPPPPQQRGGSLTFMGGSRDYLNAHLRYGGTLPGAWKHTSLMFDGMRKQGEGARENTRSGLNDYNLKSLTTMNGRQTLSLRGNYYSEDSNVTYSGLRQDEWDRNPRGNPFRNDFFYIERFGGSAHHSYAFNANAVLTTQVYGSTFFRDWWRQSSNSGQRPNDSADPVCGGMANLNTTCGNEGRLRKYYTWGVEPKLRAFHRLFGVISEIDLGVRYHSELQERRQENGPSPTSRSGLLVENNQRVARAGSAFLQNRFSLGSLAVTPGVRMEHIRYRRSNRLAASGSGVSGAVSLTEWIPGIGLTWSPASRITLFSGVHRGFAPPRVEDVINNTTGASTELESERSWNYEAGWRARVPGVTLESAFFHMDFSNQIVPASVAGGLGAVLTNGGKTLHTGLETSARWERRNLFGSRHSLALRTAFTWLPVARFEGDRFSAIPGFTAVSVRGNRLPYAPRNLVNASLSYTHSRGLHAILETVYTGSQFGDDLNTRGGTPDGQRGWIPANTLFNATLNYPVEHWRATFFLTTKNLADRLVIVDRTRGLLPGIPRLIQAGVRFSL